MAAYGMASLTYSEDPAEEYNEYKNPSWAWQEGSGSIPEACWGGRRLDVPAQGNPVRRSLSGSDFDVKMRIGEISVPVLLRFNLPVQGINPYLLGGGEIAYVAQAKYDYTISGGGDSDSGSEDIKDDVASIDYGLVFGGGLGISPAGSIS